jgi:hypothetical protein
MTFFIGTSHGVTTNSYSALLTLLGGCFQGSRSGMMVYGASQEVLLSVYRKTCTDASFVHPANNGKVIREMGSAFVDDKNYKE